MDKEMRRLDACIDACAGISTGALEAGVIRELVGAAKWSVARLDKAIPESKEGSKIIGIIPNLAPILVLSALETALTKLEQPK